MKIFLIFFKKRDSFPINAELENITQNVALFLTNQQKYARIFFAVSDLNFYQSPLLNGEVFFIFTIDILLSTLDTDEKKATLEEVYEKYDEMIYIITYSILGNKTDAEEAGFKTWKTITRLIDRGYCNKVRVKAYVSKIAESKALYIVKNKASIIEESFENADNIEDSSQNESYLAVEYESKYGKTGEAIKKLPLIYRNALTLRYVLKTTISEMAEILDLSAGGVRSRIKRAKKMLKERIKNDDA